MSNVYDPNRRISDVLGKTRANEKYTHDACQKIFSASEHLISVIEEQIQVKDRVPEEVDMLADALETASRLLMDSAKLLDFVEGNDA